MKKQITDTTAAVREQQRQALLNYLAEENPAADPVPDTETTFGWMMGEDYFDVLDPINVSLLAKAGIFQAIPNIDPDILIDNLEGKPLPHTDEARNLIRAIQDMGETAYCIWGNILANDYQLENDAIAAYGIEQFLTAYLNY